MISTTVSNVDLFRMWKDNEELDLGWILNKLLGPREQTPQMKAGEAFHKGLEDMGLGAECELLSVGPYRFEFACDCNIEMTRIRELRVQKQYGDLEIRGRVDSVLGSQMIVDYKTTGSFDPDRLMTGYQWRYYLDMMDAYWFRWNVFVFRETDDPMSYVVTEAHTLEQVRYPSLQEDCAKLAAEYLAFAKEHLVGKAAVAS